MELIVAFTILFVLSSLAVPLARSRIRVDRERDLHYALRQMRKAIDKFTDNCDAGYFGPPKMGTNCYPETLDILVAGMKLAQDPNGKKLKFLRRIPLDPFTGKPEWGMRSDQDDPNSTAWGGQDVFDVYSKTEEKAPDGSRYSEW